MEEKKADDINVASGIYKLIKATFAMALFS
jgi:hypothetical protein